MSSDETLRIEVGATAGGQRLDRYLAVELDLPRNRVQRWIRDGRVTVDARPAKASLVLTGGERIDCRPEEAPVDRVGAEPGPLDVIHEDGEIVVLNKPARLAVHPGAGRPDGTLVNRLVAAYPEMASVGGPGRPGIVHRLDIDTTGLLLLARTDAAYRRLSEDFAARRVDKTYLAICYGTPSPSEGEIELPIGRHRARRREMTVRPDGRAALTSYGCLSSAGGATLVRVGLETGRTHQIRVHFKAVGHPLVGDPVYGEARWKGVPAAGRSALRSFPRPALHAWRLRFAHPSSGATLELVAPPPADLVALWEAVSGSEIAAALSAAES